TATTMPGALCADDETVARALLDQGSEIAQKKGAKQLVLQDTRQSWPGDFTTTTQHEEWLVEVGDDEEAMSARLHRNIRRQVRMAERNGLTAEVDRTGALLDDFYSVLSRFTHQAGTPVFGRDFLKNIIALFPDGFNIVVVRHEQEPIGAYFQLEMGDTVHGAWGATLHEYLELRPVYLAYWTTIVDAIAHGFPKLNMGRSPADSNASKFKGQWGGVARPVYQQVLGLREQAVTSSVVDQAQSDAKFRSFRQIWPRVPFPIAQFLGPKLRRHVPFA
ncbi:MAG: GNAT family N-acetyltransferase, partial [Caldilineaceae bacterium]|nr:GNAT family N-acetyltransferase [Caldilineaceae bacterium]